MRCTCLVASHLRRTIRSPKLSFSTQPTSTPQPIQTASSADDSSEFSNPALDALTAQLSLILDGGSSTGSVVEIRSTSTVVHGLRSVPLYSIVSFSRRGHQIGHGIVLSRHGELCEVALLTNFSSILDDDVEFCDGDYFGASGLIAPGSVVNVFGEQIVPILARKRLNGRISSQTTPASVCESRPQSSIRRVLYTGTPSIDSLNPICEGESSLFITSTSATRQMLGCTHLPLP